jgi:hypothetical protein
MPKAILKNGSIMPTEPLPPEWKEGQELSVEALPVDDEDELDIGEWLQQLEEMVARNDPADMAAIERSIQESKQKGTWRRNNPSTPSTPTCSSRRRR